MKKTFQELFNNKKPVIAMAHLPALPGTVRYDQDAGMDSLIEKTARDVQYLVEGGVDAIMFCNEDDRPYQFQASPVQIAAMSRVITEVKPTGIPFGVDFLWDPVAALSMAMATGAAFIREVMSGVYESDMGMWAPDPAQVLQLRHNLGADHILAFFNVAPEFCSTLGDRTVAQRARSAVVSSLADVILVSGPMAGVEPNYEDIENTRQELRGSAPVLINTGARASNIQDYLRVADGVIVGSSMKQDGYTWNPVDPVRVKEFLDAARQAR